MKSLLKYVQPDQKPGIVHTDNSVGFIRGCEDLCWNHDKSTPYRSETNGISENADRRVTEGTSSLLVLLGLPDKWWGRSNGMLVLFARHIRQIGREKVTV